MIEQFLNDADDLDDFAEDFEDLDDFYSSQLNTWQQLIKSLTVDFKPNRQALEKNPGAAQALKKLDDIYQSSEPYNSINKINGLIESVEAINKQLIQEKQSHALARVAKRIEGIKQLLEESQANSDISNQALFALQQCKTRIESQTSISHIFSEQNEASALEDTAINLINDYIQERIQEQKKKKIPPLVKPVSDTTPSVQDSPYVKPIATIDPSDIYLEKTNKFIETEQEIDDYLEQLKATLLDAIKEGSRIRIR